jgi:chromosome segregation ATPase
LFNFIQERIAELQAQNEACETQLTEMQTMVQELQSSLILVYKDLDKHRHQIPDPQFQSALSGLQESILEVSRVYEFTLTQGEIEQSFRGVEAPVSLAAEFEASEVKTLQQRLETRETELQGKVANTVVREIFTAPLIFAIWC